MKEFDNIPHMIKLARKAQQEVMFLSQEEIDVLVTKIAYQMTREEIVNEIAELAVEETKLGNFEGKKFKLESKVRGGLYQCKGQKTVGIIDRDDELGLVKYAKPIGVIGAIIPSTNPEATPILKAIYALKSRNAIIFSPHPAAKRTNSLITKRLREVLEINDYPVDLIQTVEQPSIEKTNLLMAQVDMNIATGGGNLVKAAYSSGTPSYGVGAGNAVVIVDETVDVLETAKHIRRSKVFDYATSCSAENSIVAVEAIHDDLLKCLQEVGGHLCNESEKENLQANLWVDGVLNRHCVCRSAQVIADISKINIDPHKEFIIVQEDGIGPDYPFSGEKMSVVLTLYKVKDFDEAVDYVNKITKYEGEGHSCGIHSIDEERINQLALKANVSRIMVRQPQAVGNSGSWENGMPFTLTLGCGSWGGNSSSENISWNHYMNTTWVSLPKPRQQPSDEELFKEALIKL